MGLFEGISYFLSSSLPPHRKEQLEYALDRNGAVQSATLGEASHIITNTAHFEGRDRVRQGVPVVSDIWVDRSLVLGKAQPPQYYSVDPAMIFSGIVACATELPTHDLEVLCAGITALGGQWRTGLSNDVTHLFAISPNSSKYTTALAHRHSTGIRVLLPHWFDDSVRLGVRNLTLEPYLWPDPPLLRGPLAATHSIGDPAKESEKEKDEGQSKKAMMATANMFTAASDQLPFPKHTYQLPLSKQDVWGGKRILLSWTLSLYGSRREAVEVGIKRAGGEVVRYAGDDQEDDMESEEKERKRDKKEARAIPECDILITRWRNGRAYVAAFRAGKNIGTLAWLYHVQSTGLMPRPVDQLLHYPIPRRPVEGFTAHEITVTNYTGEAREYIKRMIIAMGATFTPSMSGRNTVLIAAFLKGTKAEKARAWSIPIVNHTWLEDCFVQWRNLTVGVEKYIIFPPGVDFSRMIGERGVGVRGVELCEEEEGQEADETSDESVQDKNAEGEKRVAEMDAEVNVPERHDIETIASALKSQQLTSKAQGSPRVTAVAKPVREISASVSPAKSRQKTSFSSNTSPRAANGKKSSPTKKITIRRDQDEDNAMEVDTVAGKGVGKEPDWEAGNRMVAIGMDIDGDGERRTPDVPVLKGKGKQKDVLQLSDESDDELSKTPPFYPSSAATRESNATGRATKEKASEGRIREKESKEGHSDSAREADQVVPSRDTDNETRSPARKGKKSSLMYKSDESSNGGFTVSPMRKSLFQITSPKKVSHSGEIDHENDVTQDPPQKRRLVRRATSNASLQVLIDQEKQDVADAPRKLVRRASTKAVDRENPNKEKEKEEIGKDDDDEKQDKENISAQRTSILKTSRGDARTRVKAKGARAKARELLSESEGDVVELANKKRTTAKAKGKKDTPSKKQTKKRGKALILGDDDQETQSEEERKEIPIPNPSIPASTPVRRVSVVVDHPSSVMKLRSSVTKGKGRTPLTGKSKTASDTDNNEDEDEANDSESPKTTERIKKIVKTESIHVEAGLASANSKSKTKPKTKASPTSSPLTTIQTAHSDTLKETSMSGHPRRGAATKAEQRLKVMMPDATKFEQEMRKVKKGGRSSLHGIDVGGWEGEDKESSTGSKRKKRDLELMESEEGEREQKEKRDAKKRKLSSAQEKTEQKRRDDKEEGRGKKTEKKTREDSDEDESEEVVSGAATKGQGRGNVYLMTTQANLPDTVIKGLNKLGVSMTTKPSQCTHLLAPHLVRTEKLLCALAVAPHILEVSWAINSAAAKQLLPVDRFLLKDENAEKKYDFKLSETMERARNLKGKLLAGKTFYVTPRIPVDYRLLRSVASAHGGQLVQQAPTVRLIQANPGRYVISCPDDISIWRPLAAQEIPIYTHEFLLTGVLKQELDWDNPAFRVESI